MAGKSIPSHFELGRIQVAGGVWSRLSPAQVGQVLRRHGRGDWSRIPEGSFRDNVNAATIGRGKVSSEQQVGRVRVWVITSGKPGDRRTVVVLPQEARARSLRP